MCDAVDENAYVQYFYGNSDAAVLFDQTCKSLDGNSQLEKVLDRTTDCRCYDKKVAEVIAKLSEGSGPVAVVTRKSASIAAGVTCRVALEQCEAACEQEAKAAPKSCAAVKTAGVGI